MCLIQQEPVNYCVLVVPHAPLSPQSFTVFKPIQVQEGRAEQCLRPLRSLCVQDSRDLKLSLDIIETNLLIKFHEDCTINVASRELTRQMLTPHNEQRTKGDHKSSP
ncbi:hypothetical protein DPMN_031271 [Dreissena polymorpha]|uniref:Uncharacterized protein n=1 Tax=Dreissena polymorpha TaxID=45954 RepID=A0A9D4M209_DREPO|nr:hypothetical protein DPMN_031271 [Dreissena polymorpha]